VISATVVDRFLKLVVNRGGSVFLEELTESDVYMDLFFTASPVSPATHFTGATALANKTCVAVIDGFPATIAVDSTGAFNTPYAVSSVQIGLNYTALIKLLPIIYAGGNPIRGERIRKIKSEITLLDTKDLWVDGRNIPFRKYGENLLDTPIPNQDETTIEVFLDGISNSPTITLESRSPLGQTIVSLITTLRTRAAGE
jgi:hypothetical protein